MIVDRHCRERCHGRLSKANPQRQSSRILGAQRQGRVADVWKRRSGVDWQYPSDSLCFIYTGTSMSGYFGTEMQQRLQAQAGANVAFINSTLGACQTGRTMGCDEPDRLGWKRIIEFLDRDGICGFRLISGSAVEALRSQLVERGLSLRHLGRVPCRPRNCASGLGGDLVSRLARRLGRRGKADRARKPIYRTHTNAYERGRRSSVIRFNAHRGFRAGDDRGRSRPGRDVVAVLYGYLPYYADSDYPRCCPRRSIRFTGYRTY